MADNKYRKFAEIKTTLGIWATIIILDKNNGILIYRQLLISQNIDLAVNLADTTSRYFQKTWAIRNP